MSSFHPKTIFVSSRAPSAAIFALLSNVDLGIGSLFATLLLMMSIAKGTAAFSLGRLDGVSRPMFMLSSKNTSDFAIAMSGISTDSGWAWAKGISSGLGQKVSPLVE